MEEHKFIRTVGLLYGVSSTDITSVLSDEVEDQLRYLESKRRPYQRKASYQEAMKAVLERAAGWLNKPCTSIEFPIEAKRLAHLVGAYRKAPLFFSTLHHLGRTIGGKSFCTCGHTGDGPKSQHGGEIGHGSCMVKGCKCEKFTWKEFIDL